MPTWGCTNSTFLTVGNIAWDWAHPRLLKRYVILVRRKAQGPFRWLDHHTACATNFYMGIGSKQKAGVSALPSSSNVLLRTCSERPYLSGTNWLSRNGRFGPRVKVTIASFWANAATHGSAATSPILPMLLE